jgi:hypothetical protein
MVYFDISRYSRPSWGKKLQLKTTRRAGPPRKPALYGYYVI